MPDTINELARLLEKRGYWVSRMMEAQTNIADVNVKITALQAEYAKTEEKP